MKIRTAVALCVFAVTTSLFAQTPDELPRPIEPAPVVFTESTPNDSAANRKLRFASESQTLNYIPKFDGSAQLVDSVMFESSSKIGIGTNDPKAPLHIFGTATSDVYMGIGPDPSGATASALTIGYGGFTYGRGSAFLNVRPDGSATSPNPSLRFLIGNVERMLITSNGSVAVGSTVQGKFTVGNGTDAGRAFYAYQRATVESTTAQNDTAYFAYAGNDVAAGATNTGTVTGGQTEGWNFGPGAVTTTIGGSFNTGVYPSITTGSVTNATAVRTAVYAGTGATVTNGYGIMITDTAATNDWGLYQVSTNDSNYFAGNVIIGGPSTVTIPANNVLYVKGESYFEGL